MAPVSRLADVQQELDNTKDKSATTLLATEDEILQLRAEYVQSSDHDRFTNMTTEPVCGAHSH